VRVPFEIAEVLVDRHLRGPGPLQVAGRGADVIDRRSPRGVVGVVVLRPERLEDERILDQSLRDSEVGRNEERVAHAEILSFGERVRHA
jgi:hypothetical protein